LFFTFRNLNVYLLLVQNCWLYNLYSRRQFAVPAHPLIIIIIELCPVALLACRSWVDFGVPVNFFIGLHRFLLPIEGLGKILNFFTLWVWHFYTCNGLGKHWYPAPLLKLIIILSYFLPWVRYSMPCIVQFAVFKKTSS